MSEGLHCWPALAPRQAPQGRWRLLRTVRRCQEQVSVKGCQEKVGSRLGDGYRDVNAAVDWIVISSHGFSLVQLPGRSIIPPGVGWDLIRPGVWLPSPHSPTPPSSSPSHSH